MAESTTPDRGLPSRGERYFVNVLWNWTGVALNIFVGFVLAPYMIRKLGSEGYGLWTLLTSLIAYYGLLELGLHSALSFHCFQHAVTKDSEKINGMINTLQAHYLLASLILMAIAAILSPHIGRIFQISSAYQGEYSLLLILAAIGWVWAPNTFVGCLDGFQRFDLSFQVYAITLLLRSMGSFLWLTLGYGLLALGVNLVFAQVVGMALGYYFFRLVFPELRISAGLVQLSAWKQMAGYGIHTSLASLAGRGLDQSAALLIGYFLPTAYVGYYSVPVRLLQSTGELVLRVGWVTAPNAAELAARGRPESVLRLGIYSNRYCLALFMPLTIVLLLYSRELLEVWIGPEYGLHSAPLLPVLAAATGIAMGGQFNSSSILYGLGKHRKYAQGLMVEALVNIVGMILVIPRYGIVGVAWVSAIPMILVRGIYTAWLVCHSLHSNLIAYLRSIFVRPLLTALPVFGVAYWLKIRYVPGRGWVDLIGISLLVSLLYLGAAYFTCLEDEHRSLVRGWVGRKIKRQKAKGKK